VKLLANDVIPAVYRTLSLSWLRTANPGLNSVFDISGPSAQCLIQSADIGSNLLIPGTAITAYNGCTINIKDGTLRGFDTGIAIPNIGSGPIMSVLEVAAWQCTHDITISNPLSKAVIAGVFNNEKVTIDPATDVALLILDPEEIATFAV